MTADYKALIRILRNSRGMPLMRTQSEVVKFSHETITRFVFQINRSFSRQQSAQIFERDEACGSVIVSASPRHAQVGENCDPHTKCLRATDRERRACCGDLHSQPPCLHWVCDGAVVNRMPQWYYFYCSPCLPADAFLFVAETKIRSIWHRLSFPFAKMNELKSVYETSFTRPGQLT